MRLILALTTVAILSGCASGPPDKTLSARIETIPEGATVYSEGKRIGISPTVGWQQVDDYQIEKGYIVSQVTAVWKSGATWSGKVALNWTPGDSRGTSSVVIRRPNGAPGLSTDVEYAQELQKPKGDGGSFAALALGATTEIAQEWAASEHSRLKSAVDCVSTRNGNTTYTDCQ